MKYVRTKDEVLDYERTIDNIKYYYSAITFPDDKNNIENDIDELNKSIIKQSDTIEELCDAVVIKYKNEKPQIIDCEELINELKEQNISLKDHLIWLKKSLQR